jgi:hypothetical protein
VDTGASGARNRRNEESIAQRSRRSQRGDGIGGESAAVNIWPSVRESCKRESIAQRSRHRGGWDWWGKRCGERLGIGCENGKRGKHHTEVTEASEGLGLMPKGHGERPGFRCENQANGKRRFAYSPLALTLPFGGESPGSDGASPYLQKKLAEHRGAPPVTL